jgi:hypothetical protein
MTSLVGYSVPPATATDTAGTAATTTTDKAPAPAGDTTGTTAADSAPPPTSAAGAPTTSPATGASTAAKEERVLREVLRRGQYRLSGSNGPERLARKTLVVCGSNERTMRCEKREPSMILLCILRMCECNGLCDRRRGARGDRTRDQVDKAHHIGSDRMDWV